MKKNKTKGDTNDTMGVFEKKTKSNFFGLSFLFLGFLSHFAKPI